jgi:very-short-patch-repair endonuclease
MKKDDLTKKTLRENIEKCLGLETGEELQFHPTRKWSFDVVIPEHSIALEIEGGSWNGGRHTRGKGFLGDMEKYNEALRLGWKVIRLTPQQVNSNYIIDLITDLIWKE